MANNNTEKKAYIIRVQGVPQEVEPDVYLAYYGMARREKTLEEKDARNGRLLYSGLDTSEMLGEETIPDANAIPVEQAVVDKMMAEQLHRVLELLPPSEKALITALFYDGQLERDVAAMLGISQSGVSRRKKKALAEIKKMMKI